MENSLLERLNNPYEKKLDDLVYPHIMKYNSICEYVRRIGSSFICEARGLSDEVKNVTDNIVSYVYEYINQHMSVAKTNEQYEFKIMNVKDICNCSFFTNAIFYIVVDRQDNIVDNNEAGYNADDSSIVEDEDGNKLLNAPAFKLHVTAPYMQIGKQLKVNLYHELTHAYEDYKLMLNNINYSLKDYVRGNNNVNVENTEDVIRFFNERTVYERAQRLRGSDMDEIAQMVGCVMYITNEAEIKSFVAQAHAEIEKFNYVSFLNLPTILANLTVYEHILYLEKSLYRIGHMNEEEINDLRTYLMLCLDAKETNKDYIKWFTYYIRKKLEYFYAKVSRIVSMKFYGTNPSLSVIKDRTQKIAATEKHSINLTDYSL